MKISRIVAWAAIALLIAGMAGVAAVRSLAQPAQPPAQTGVAGSADSGQAAAPAPGHAEEQAGDQNASDTGEEVNAQDTDNVEAADGRVGDQNTADTGEEVNEAGDGQETAPAGTPAITADQAQAAAEASLNAGTASKVELDDENGQLVYSVEIGSSDVKVDAMTGAVLGVETGED
jgi:uncharacterized membrane protein YkoI